MSSPTDQRIDYATAGSSTGRIDRTPGGGAVAEIHVTRLVINAEHVETSVPPATKQKREAAEGQTQTHTHHRRHSESELFTVAAVVPVAAPPSPVHSRATARPQYGALRVPPGPVLFVTGGDETAGPVPRGRDGAGPVPRGIDGAARNRGRQPAPAQPPAQGRPPRSKCDELMSRCCLFCVVIPFVLAVSLMGLSLSTFAVMDYRVRKSCSSLTCSLSCYNQTESTFRDCGVIYAGGGLVCLMSFLSIFSIAIRICCGVSILGSCVVCEIFIHLINLAVGITVAFTLSIGTEFNKSCLHDRCGGLLDVQELIDFMKEAEIGAWLSVLMMMLVVFLWMLLGLRTCCEPYGRRRRQGQREDDERQRLVDT